MKKVTVITGGGSGMGLATAKIMGRENYIIIAGRTVNKLEQALQELRAAGVEAESFACDVSSRESVDALATRAREIGPVTSVIHAAGISPHMGEAETIMKTNAIGTININDAFYAVMEEGSCLVDIASMAGHMVPAMILPVKQYRYSRIDTELFFKKLMARVSLLPKKHRSGLAYAISKNFVIWYAKTDAARFGKKGARVLSVSPGPIETPMGALEREQAGKYARQGALGRFGKLEEIAELLAFCASEKPGYLTGVDILCDGGIVTLRKYARLRP